MTTTSASRRGATGAAVLAVAALGLVPATAGTAPEVASAGSASLQHVKNLPFAPLAGSTPNRGTDIEFAELAGRQHALAGTYQNGLQIIDIEDPANPVLASVYSCGVQQGDVQVFTREVAGVERTYAGFTHDTGYTAKTGTKCFNELKTLKIAFGSGFGTVIADITDPKAPTTVSFVPFTQGSHNHTIDPSGRFLYNSNSDLVTSLAGGLTQIEVTDITDLANPKALPGVTLPPIPTGLGVESHDITFNTKGDRAYSAALSQTVLLDTSNPAAPTVISTIVDPTINVHHQADPVTITDPVLGKRDFLVIEDEFAGAIGTGQCPNGGVHVYDISREATPVKVGFWNITDAGPTPNGIDDGCTAHVFDLHEEQAIMTIAYYNGGVRVVDISGLVGVSLGATDAVGMREVGFRRFDNSDTWAAKTPKINKKDGSFFLFGNDQVRGLDVYKYAPVTAAGSDKAKGTGMDRWLGAADAARLLPKATVDASYKMMCLRESI